METVQRHLDQPYPPDILQTLTSIAADGKPWDVAIQRTLDAIKKPMKGTNPFVLLPASRLRECATEADMDALRDSLVASSRREALALFHAADFSTWPALLADLERLTLDLQAIRGRLPRISWDEQVKRFLQAQKEANAKQSRVRPTGQPLIDMGEILMVDLASDTSDAGPEPGAAPVDAQHRDPEQAGTATPQEAATGGDDDGQDTARGGELPECLVTLQQAAPFVNRSKRTLERLKKRKGFPRPRIVGGGGKPHEYVWSELRTFLVAYYGRGLPETFPAQRFRPV